MTRLIGMIIEEPIRLENGWIKVVIGPQDLKMMTTPIDG
jgi:hypothetical protein